MALIDDIKAASTTVHPNQAAIVNGVVASQNTQRQILLQSPTLRGVAINVAVKGNVR
jgi:hypothetical protein